MTRILMVLAMGLGVSGCMAGGAVVRESPARAGFAVYLSPPLVLDFVEAGEGAEVSLNPTVGIGSIDGASLVHVGGQGRWRPADAPYYAGAETAFVSVGGSGGFTVGVLGGYDLPRIGGWPVSAFGSVGFARIVGTGVYGRLGVEFAPPQLLDLWGDIIDGP